MREVVWKWAGALGLMTGLAVPLCAAEEAWRTDGRRVSGTLALEKGRLRLTPTQGEAIPLANLTRIRFAEGTPAPFRVGGGRRVHLRDGQQITGQFLGLNKDTLTMRTAWATRIELPRAAVLAIDSLPGWRMVASDDFRDGLKAFTTEGEPTLTQAGMEPRSVLQRTAGQRLVYTPAKSLEAGRIGINFQEQGQASGARWTFEMLFQEGERPQRIAVSVAGEGEHYAVDAGGLKGEARSVARTAGWHRLIVSFSKRSLRVSCDDDVVWYNLEQGAGGLLKQVTIHCHKLAPDEEARGAVAWTEFCLERAVEEHPRPPVEAELDEVRLSSDDQLFGRILQADRRAIQIEGRFGKRSLPWTEVTGCTFRRMPAPPRPAETAMVRLVVRSGLDPEADAINGVVTALDERTLILRHALLGELKFERDRVRSLGPLSGAAK